MHLHLARHLSTPGGRRIIFLIFLVCLGASCHCAKRSGGEPCLRTSRFEYPGPTVGKRARQKLSLISIRQQLVLRFEPVTPELLALNVFDNFVLSPTPVLPTGFQGSLTKQTAWRGRHYDYGDS